MQVLSDIAGSVAAGLDRAARALLGHERRGEALRRDALMLRRVMAFHGVAMIALPATLAAIAGPAAGLPLGFATVLASFLIATVVAQALARAHDTETADEVATCAAEPFSASLCPGLLLSLDPHGHVLAADGRDRDRYLAGMREPFGRPLADQLHVSDRIAFLQALDGLRQGGATAVADVRLERPALGRGLAQFATVRLDLTARRGDDGEISGIVAQMLDIAAEASARADAAELRGAVDDANEAKSRFLAAVSHELRTPLNAILGFSDILAGEYFGKLQNDRQREYVQLIRQSGAHLLSVVNAMLDMSKIEAGRYELVMENFAVAETVAECENMLGLQAREKGVVLTSRLGRGLGEVVADQRALRQILINLVGNAVKFTEQGGAVIIDATVEGSELKIAVSDTGIGIAPARMALIGQPFTQAHDDLARRYEGSGLGLSLVKGLTALHGGRFEIASREGEGTVVTITVPTDGSGVLPGAIAGGEGNTVEFPPRLKSAAARGDNGPETEQKDRMTNGAKAKIA